MTAKPRFDPTEPSYECRFGGPDEPDGAVGGILRQMPELTPHAASLQRLIDGLRHQYLYEYHDWLATSSAEGGRYRPFRKLADNWDPDEEPVTGYDAYAAHQLTEREWREWWDLHFAKPRAANGNRARNPGRFRGDKIDPPLGRPPVAALYHRVNRWWRETVGTPFRPDFSGVVSAANDSDRMSEINPAARLFVLLAQEADHHLTVDHCRRVHTEEGRRQNTAK